MQQQIQQQQQAAPARDPETRLSLLEGGFAELRAMLQDIRGDLKARTKIDWTPIGILLTVLIAAGTTAFTWINQGQGRIELLIAKMEQRSESYMKREDIVAQSGALRADLEAQLVALRTAFREQFEIAKERRNDLQAKTDDRIARGEKDTAAMQAQVVPRGEHEQMWAGQRSKDEGLQRQIDELRKGLTDLNTPRDTIQGMQRRIDEIERMRWDALPRR